MPKLKAILLTLLSVLFSAAFLKAQDQSDSDSLIRLDYGKTAELIEIDGQSVRKVIGPAEFMHNNTFMLCDTALWNIDTQIIDAIGHVSLIQEGTVLTSDSMVYYIDQDLAQFRGHLVQLEDSDRNTLRTSWLDYNTKDSVAVFDKGGSMRDKDGQLIESIQGTYDAKIKLFTFSDDVNMFTDSIFVKTTYLEYESPRNLATFGRGTDAWKEDNMLSADAGWYDRDREIFFFRNNVHVMNDTQEGWSDSLYFWRYNKNLEMLGNAQITDTSRNVTGVAGRITYIDTISTVTMLRDPAIIARMDQDDKIDTVYAGADTIKYYTLRMFEVDTIAKLNAQKRLQELDVDPVGEYRAAAAEAARKAAEEALKNDPNYRPPEDENANAMGAAPVAGEMGPQQETPTTQEESKQPPQEAPQQEEPEQVTQQEESVQQEPPAEQDAGVAEPGVEEEGPEPEAGGPEENGPEPGVEEEGPESGVEEGDMGEVPDSLNVGSGIDESITGPTEEENGAGGEGISEGLGAAGPVEDIEGQSSAREEVGNENISGAGMDENVSGPDSEGGSLRTGADSLGTGTDSLSVGRDSLGVGTDSLGVGRDSLGVGLDSLGVGADSLGVAVDSLAGPLDTTKVNFIWAVGNIKLYKSDMQMVCDSLEYCDLDSLVRMYKGTVIWNEITQQYSADSVTAVINNGRFQKASLMSDSYIVIEEEPDKYYDQIKSVESLAFFDSTGVLTRFDALGSAVGAFFLREEDVVATANKTDSKMMSALFVGGGIDRVFYYQEVKSDAYPVVQLAKEEQTFKGFNWQPERRPASPEDVTTVKPRSSMRGRYKSRPRAAFTQTELYFPGYIPGIYREIALRDSLERVRDRQRRFAEEIAAQEEADSLAWAGIAFMADSLASEIDTLQFSDSLALADSLAKADIKALEDMLEKADTLSAQDSLAAKDSLAALEEKIVVPPTKEELKAQALAEKEKARAEREAARQKKLEEKEAKWAQLDSIDAAKVDAKLAKKAAKEREKKRKYLEKMDRQTAKEDARLENYVHRIEVREEKLAARGKPSKIDPNTEASMNASAVKAQKAADKQAAKAEKAAAKAAAKAEKGSGTVDSLEVSPGAPPQADSVTTTVLAVPALQMAGFGSGDGVSVDLESPDEDVYMEENDGEK